MIDTLTLTLHNRELRNDTTGQAVRLAEKTTQFFLCLVGRQRQTVTYEVLQRAIWKQVENEGHMGNLRLQASYLRAKLESVGVIDAIETIHGIGYVMDAQQIIKVIDTSIIKIDHDECDKCKLPECVEVDSTIDKAWCRLNPEYDEVKTVNRQRRKWEFATPQESRLKRIERIINDNGGALPIAKLIAASNIPSSSIYAYVNAGYITTEKRNVLYAVGVSHKPLQGNKTEYTFDVLRKEDSYIVRYKPSGSRQATYCFESANPYLAMAMIAKEMALKYGEIIE